MKRGGPLKRKAPLKATAGGLKRTAIAPRSGGSKTDFPSAVKTAVTRRSGGRCENLGCVRRADHFHHRLMRSHGGPGTAENCAHLCSSCHTWVHANPARAYELGLLVRSGAATM